MTSPRDSELVISGAGALLLLAIAGLASLAALRGLTWLSALAFGGGWQAASDRVRSSLLALTFAQSLGLGLALVAGVRWFGGEGPRPQMLRLGPVRTGTLALSLLGGACLQFPLAELSNLVHHHVLGPEPIENQLAMQAMIEARSLGEGTWVVLCLVAAIPAMEELFFRGLLLTGLCPRYGDAAAVLASACLFGLSHLDATAAIYAAVAGIVLGALARRTRSIWPSIAMHAGVNAMPVVLPERVIALPGFNVPSPMPLHLPIPLVLGSLVLGCACLAQAARIEYAASR